MTRPTIHDVAIKAKVSTATVSRVINLPDMVSARTAKLVNRVIDQLGYTPNFGGQVLASQRTNTIGAIIPTMDNAIFARGLQAFQSELSEVGVTTIVASTNYDAATEEQQIRKLVSRGADGFLLIGDARNQSVYDFLVKREIPFVIAWEYRKSPEKIFIGFDNFKAGSEVAKIVSAYGHTNVGMISGIRHMNDRATNRANGVQQHFASQGYHIPIVEAAYSFDAAGIAFRQLISNFPDITTAICGNDVLAVGAIREAKAMRFNVPDDISITGFDDIDIAEVVSPSLTTVHVPHRSMGIAAAKALLSLTRDKAPLDQAVELLTFMKIRQSLRRI